MPILFLLLVPVGVRLFVGSRFSDVMGDVLPEAELDRDSHRTLIAAMAGFSFTAVAALAVLDVSTQLRVGSALFLLFGSFLAYLWALNIQGYKARRWHDMFGNTLVEVAMLAMLLALCSLIAATSASHTEQTWVFATAGIVWLVDFVARVRLDWQYLTHLRQAPKKPGA